MLQPARPISIAALAALFALAGRASAAPAAHLRGTPTSGTAPLVVGFDTAQSSAGTIAENLVLVGNGDAVSLPMAAQTTNYNFTLPGFYLAQTWLRDDSGIALSAPVPISVARQSDGRMPPTATLTVAATTDPSTFAFMATVTAAGGDPIAAQRWDFGDGTGDGTAAPFHTFAHGGVYQAALVASTRAGLPLYARTVVVVGGAASDAVAPSLLVTASPEDASLLTPVTVTAYVEGVAPDAKVTSAEVAWPDFVDASPTVTPTAAGLTLTSQHAVATPGSYAVPVTIALASAMQPLVATVRVRVAVIDGGAPSPVLLAAPAATLGSIPYSPGTSSGALLVAGNGPFAFGPASPSPAGFSVDDDGKIEWTPTLDQRQVGFQRLSVRVTDVNGQEIIASWVVNLAGGGKSGCALGGEAAPSRAWPFALVVLALAVRRRRATA